jgi:hypothetical protein
MVWKLVFGSKKMEARIKFFIISLAVLASTCFAQSESATEGTPPDSSAGVRSFPYVAQITADDVLVRSGPGTNHYACGKLNKADKVTVVGSLFGWSRIVPPAGSFSWIHARYLQLDPGSPSAAVVIGNAVPAYVGAEDRDPIHCDRMQLKLNKDDKVALLGEPQDGYYKISPPGGAYLWVSTRYTQPLEARGEAPPPSFTPPADTCSVTAVPISASMEEAKLREFYDLQKRMDAERVKPMSEQDYGDIKRAMQVIAGNIQAGKAARYAQFGVEQVARCELALEVDKTIRLQDEQLEQIRENLAKARVKRLAEIEYLGRYAVMGKLQPSTTYGPGHYRIVDDSGKTVCYALPAGQVAQMDLSSFLGRKVGLTGSIESHPQTQGALVRFSGIEPLQ